jgi:hypothetical protein
MRDRWVNAWGKLPGISPFVRIKLFREEKQIVSGRRGPLEDGPRLLEPTLEIRAAAWQSATNPQSARGGYFL